jgi:hypothetical protein
MRQKRLHSVASLLVILPLFTACTSTVERASSPNGLVSSNNDTLGELSAELLGRCPERESASEIYGLYDLVTTVPNWYTLSALNIDSPPGESRDGHMAVSATGTAIQGAELPAGHPLQLWSGSAIAMQRTLRAGAEVVVAVNGASTHIVAGFMLDDTDMPAFVAPCAYNAWTVPYRSFLQQTDRTPVPMAEMGGLLGANAEEARSDLLQALMPETNVVHPEGQIHPDFTPPELLAQFQELELAIWLPDVLRSSDEKLCTRTREGWTECAMADSAVAGDSLSIRAYAKPSATLEVWLFASEVEPASGAPKALLFEAPMESLSDRTILEFEDEVQSWSEVVGNSKRMTVVP